MYPGIVSYEHVICNMFIFLYECVAWMYNVHIMLHICRYFSKVIPRFLRDFIMYFSSFSHSQLLLLPIGLCLGLRCARPHQEWVLEHHQKVTLMNCTAETKKRVNQTCLLRGCCDTPKKHIQSMFDFCWLIISWLQGDFWNANMTLEKCCFLHIYIYV